jgi:sugar phosphate isomerase/epimerase
MSFRVSIQLYTIRSETSADMLGACRRLHEMGYRWVETAGYGNSSAKELAAALSEIGVGVSGAHIGPELLDDPNAAIEECRTLQTNCATLPWLPEQMRDSAKAWRESGARLESAAAAFQDAGIRLGYHNHQFEFQRFDGVMGIDILAEAAPTADLQIDVMWAAVGGVDPATLIRRYAGRIESIHVKDLAEDGDDIEFGHGVIDWKNVLSAAKDADVRTLVVEMDTPRMKPFDSARESLANLRRLLADDFGESVS